MTVTYRDAGVDIDAGDQFVKQIGKLVESTNRPGVIGSIGGFSGMFALNRANYQDPLLVAATDGVGTKLKLAHLVGDHSTVGIDLVAMCVNDIVVTGAEPLFFLDYFATGRLDPKLGASIVSGIVDGCRQAGCALLGGETAEMPGFYQGQDYDLAGFAVGVVERDGVLGPDRVKAGDTLLGMGASGLHSNGFSLVRKVLIDSPGCDLSRVPEGFDLPLGQELLRPTRIYVKLALELIAKADVHALAHITGGGLPGNLPRVLPGHLAAEVDRKSWSVPPVFRLVQETGQVADAEMLRTFNLGVGMVVVLSRDRVGSALECAERHQVPCWPIGQVVERRKDASQFILEPALPS